MADAFAPASITTVFVPRKEHAAGSLGVSFAIEDGVEVSVTLTPNTQIILEGSPVSFDPIEILLERLDVTASVEVVPDVPLGRGLGASGAATLATAVALRQAGATDHSRDELLQAAHQAELAAGTGQGDVFVQDRGGLVWNTGDGVRRRERSDEIEYTAFDAISTPEILGDEAALQRISAAGFEALGSFEPTAELGNWFSTAWDFARRTGLASDRVMETVQAVRRDGGGATMAMIGETVVAAGVDGVLESTTRIDSTGARVLSAED